MSALDDISIPTPCNADWDKMIGGERVRFCQRCNKNVYNLSDMSRDEAERLLTETDGELCATFFQRPDGTLVSGSKCPTYRRPNHGVAAGALIAAASLTWALPTADPILRHGKRPEKVERRMGAVAAGSRMKALPPPKSEVPNRLGDEPIFASPQQWITRSK